ncbi:hypothetical protein SADUNF_Sadunf16G0028500 [Salix dunnii]|uniref:Alpha/beta hydrolase fold-3 domain-containing protein n=1 Tax=Salix dunnii TaxID=1413687 RepID=A0A835J4Q8_9ROSI|nr:hypothetical protein SADUNF_Sadunf16G0028500 [Salix dunnii]
MDTGKKIVAEVSGYLRVFEDGTVDRTWTGPPEFGFLMEPVSPHEEFIDGVAVRDQTIEPKSGLAVRIYIPERNHDVHSMGQLPVILHFHGGGYCISQPDMYMYYHYYTRLVRSAQAICVSVYLRRAPEHKLPAPSEDAYAAFLWLRAIARGDLSDQWIKSYADFSRIYLVGDSTGGNLVHQVAARAGADDIEPLRIGGGVAIHPGFLRAEPSKSFLELPDNPLLTREMVNKFMSFALPAGSTKDHPITCPMGPQAPPLATLKLCPMLVMVAELDLLRDSELEYCEEMKKAGKEVEVLMNHGMGHSFYFNKIAIDMDPETASHAQKIIDEIISFMKRN